MTAPWTLAAAGDAIITHRLDALLRHDAAVRTVQEFVGAADIASVNLENCVFDTSAFRGWPAAQSGGGYLVGAPGVLDDLRSFGFDLLARGNNHALDFGVEGLAATDRAVDERGLVHAGTGEHLSAAARAAYLDSHIGRVALVSFTTTFPVLAKAGLQRHDTTGRPGVNGVTIDRTLHAPADLRAELEGIAATYGRPTLWREANLELADGEQAELVAAPNRRDLDRILGSIEIAAAFADQVIVNAHSHEPSNPVREVPAWFRSLARSCVDAGATAFVGHGPHQLRGIEVHRRRPIFYSLGNFICQRDAHDPIPSDQYERLGLDPLTTQPHEYVTARDSGSALLNMTADHWYESVVPVVEFDGGTATSIRLHPIDLDASAPAGRRGIPRPADPETSERILDRLALLSPELADDIRSGVIKI